MELLANPLAGAGSGRSQPAALPDYWHEHAGLLIVKPLQLLAILVLALMLRVLAHRWINRLSAASVAGRVPAILSPLTERAGALPFQESTGLRTGLPNGQLSERRKQRADTIVVKDFLAGMFLMLEDQYGVGDVIDIKEATGTVEAVGLRTTRLRDVEGTAWYVRNGEIVRVGNKSQQYAQVVLDVPVGIGQDVPAAHAAISAAAAELYADQDWLPSLLAAPEVLGIEQLGREETVLRLVARVKPLEQWRVARELRARIRAKLDGAQVDSVLPG